MTKRSIPLRNYGRAGDTVAIQGIGGLGHLGVQYAKKMGFRTVAIGFGPDKEHLAPKLGAHVYIDAKAEDAGAALQKLGGADVILATAPSGAAIASLLPGLSVRGRLVVVGVSADPIPVNGVPLIFGGRSVIGSLTGRAIETQDTLDFSVLTDVRPMIETLPLENAEEAYRRMLSGAVRTRCKAASTNRYVKETQMNQFQKIFDKQKTYFDSDATKSYEWRIDQLTRLENLCNENAEALEAAMSSDFKTARQEKVFEIMAPVGTAAFAKQELKEWMKPACRSRVPSSHIKERRFARR